MNSEIINADEYEIGYAYPTSDLAEQLGQGDAGCHYVATAASITPHPTFADALRHARALGAAPGRWSRDHPLNVHFLSDADKALVERQE